MINYDNNDTVFGNVDAFSIFMLTEKQMRSNTTYHANQKIALLTLVAFFSAIGWFNLFFFVCSLEICNKICFQTNILNNFGEYIQIIRSKIYNSIQTIASWVQFFCIFSLHSDAYHWFKRLSFIERFDLDQFH